MNKGKSSEPTEQRGGLHSLNHLPVLCLPNSQDMKEMLIEHACEEQILHMGHRYNKQKTAYCRSSCPDFAHAAPDFWAQVAAKRHKLLQKHLRDEWKFPHPLLHRRVLDKRTVLLHEQREINTEINNHIYQH